MVALCGFERRSLRRRGANAAASRARIEVSRCNVATGEAAHLPPKAATARGAPRDHQPNRGRAILQRWARRFCFGQRTGSPRRETPGRASRSATWLEEAKGKSGPIDVVGLALFDAPFRARLDALTAALQHSGASANSAALQAYRAIYRTVLHASLRVRAITL